MYCVYYSTQNQKRKGEDAPSPFLTLSDNTHAENTVDLLEHGHRRF